MLCELLRFPIGPSTAMVPLLLTVGCAGRDADSGSTANGVQPNPPTDSPRPSKESAPDIDPPPMYEKDCREWIDFPTLARFAYSKSNLDANAQEELQKGAAILVRRIEEQRDIIDILVSGLAYWGEPNPEELSMLRATVVRDFLISEGLPPGLMKAKAYGGERPSIEHLDVDHKTERRKVWLKMLVKCRLRSPKD